MHLDENNCKNSCLMLELSQPYTMGLDTADDMATTWQIAKIRYNFSAETSLDFSGGYSTSTNKLNILNGSQLAKNRMTIPEIKCQVEPLRKRSSEKVHLQVYSQMPNPPDKLSSSTYAPILSYHK